jgi:hypothetical protein
MASDEMSQKDILLGLDQKVDTLIVQMATVIANADNSGDIVKDHEARLRRLEKWRYGFPSIAVLSLIVSFSVFIFYLIHYG